MNIFNSKTATVGVAVLIVAVVFIGFQNNSRLDVVNDRLKSLDSKLRVLDKSLVTIDKKQNNLEAKINFNTETISSREDVLNSLPLITEGLNEVSERIKNKDVDIIETISEIQDNLLELRISTEVYKDHEHPELIPTEEETNEDLNKELQEIDGIETPEIVEESVVWVEETEDEAFGRGATGGFGVLTGEHVVGKNPPVEKPVVVSCPKPLASVNFSDYIQNVSFNRSMKFIVTFDVIKGQVTNERYSREIFKRLQTAVSRYLNDSIEVDNNFTKLECSIPFAIKV